MSHPFQCNYTREDNSDLTNIGNSSIIPAAKYLKGRFNNFGPDKKWIEVHTRYPVLATPHFLDLIKTPDNSDPVFMQVFPSISELDDDGLEDPMDEGKASPVKGLLHRYEAKALLLVTSKCFVHCRHCMRKRLWKENKINISWQKCLPGWTDYIKKQSEISEVILSGGDCLTLKNNELGKILEAVSNIDHVKSVRIHSRALVTKPKRIERKLAELFNKNKVKRFITQFNHPAEISEKSLEAIKMLLDAGIKVENQAVLLKGVNDKPEVLAGLFKKLLSQNITPYYLHHPDKATGAMHFYLSMEDGHKIFKDACESLTSEEIPKYVIDVPGKTKTEVKIKVGT
jgi:lysine 2,3-aminomutase